MEITVIMSNIYLSTKKVGLKTIFIKVLFVRNYQFLLQITPWFCIHPSSSNYFPLITTVIISDELKCLSKSIDKLQAHSPKAKGDGVIDSIHDGAENPPKLNTLTAIIIISVLCVIPGIFSFVFILYKVINNTI